MNRSRPKIVRFLSLAMLSLLLLFTSVAAAPYQPAASDGAGSLCNYSSWDLTVLLQKSGRRVSQTVWKVLPAGSCQNDRVVAVVGRTCPNNNCVTQLLSINSGQAVALNSLQANSTPGLGMVAVVSMDRAARLSTGQRAYALDRVLRDNPNLKKLSYSLGLEKIRLASPVTGRGYGLVKAFGSPPHTGLDVYALDFGLTVGNDRRSANVSAALAGQVVYSDCTTDYGCAVVVRSANINQWGVIYYATYARLANTGRPALGAVLEKGAVLGRIDQSNGLQTAHLHFNMRVSNLAYDGAAALYGNGAMYPINARMFMR